MIQDLWYKNTVIYSLDLETFMDANGDGVGDFEGLMRRLDYLESLGVGAIWLSPFQPTPNRDDGYDIRDYYGWISATARVGTLSSSCTKPNSEALR
jgi:maltose alpha-D-glucosyltransferase/alpha-amylase